MRRKMMMAGFALGVLAAMGAGAANHDSHGVKAINLVNVGQFEIYAAPAFEVADSGGPVTVTQNGSWLSVTAPYHHDGTSVRIGVPDVHEIRVVGGSGTVTGFSLHHDLLVTASDTTLQLSANAASVAVYTSDGASVEVRGSADNLHLMARDSTVAVTDFDAVRAVVDLREESVGRIDGLSAELAYRVYDESELYYAPGTRLGQPYHVGDDATFSTL